MLAVLAVVDVLGRERGGCKIEVLLGRVVGVVAGECSVLGSRGPPGGPFLDGGGSFLDGGLLDHWTMMHAPSPHDGVHVCG